MNKTLTTHRQRDWKEYNNALKKRASLDFWLREEVIEGWTKVERSGKRGHPFLYSEIAIMFLATISQLFHLPLRQTEGFVRSLFSLSFLPLPVPSFSTLCRRRKGLRVEVFRVVRERMREEGIVVIVDSSGVKVMGKGEWAKRRERKEIGRMERKGWIKVHLCIDFETGKILEFCLTDERVHESKVFKKMMEGIERRGEKVREVIMDGGYDRGEVWREIERMGAKGVIKVRRDGKEGGVLKGRDETIREMREKGFCEWAKEKGYGRRNKVEAIFSRLKGIFGDRVRARSWEGRESEIGVRIWILNRMLEMGDGMSCMVGS
jgi:transposase